MDAEPFQSNAKGWSRTFVGTHSTSQEAEALATFCQECQADINTVTERLYLPSRGEHDKLEILRYSPDW